MVECLSAKYHIWKPLALVVPNMVLNKLNIQKLVSQHTRGRYMFQPLWVSDCILQKYEIFAYRPLQKKIEPVVVSLDVMPKHLL